MSSDAAYLRRGALTLGLVTMGGYLTDYAFNLGLTRSLTPHGYGDFKVAFSFAYFFGLAVLLGGDRAAPMVLSPCLERGEQRKVWAYLRFYLGNGIALSLALIAVTWTASFLHVGSPHPQHHHPLALAAVAVPLNAVAAMVSRTLQSAKRPAWAVVPWRIGLPVLQLALIGLVVGLRGRLGVEEAVAIGIVVTASLAALQWHWMRRLGLVEIARAPESREGRQWLRASLPMMGTFMVALALNQSDLYFLEALGDEAEVGHYAAAATVAHLVMLGQTTVIGLIAPIARPAIESGEATSRATLRQGHSMMLRVSIPLAVVLAAAGGPILSTFGSEYQVADAVLALLVLGNLTWALAAISSLWLQYQGRAGIVLGISVATLAVDSVLNLLLIPRYGMTGAAAGTAATLSAAALATILARRRG